MNDTLSGVSTGGGHAQMSLYPEVWLDPMLASDYQALKSRYMSNNLRLSKNSASEVAVLPVARQEPEGL